MKSKGLDGSHIGVRPIGGAVIVESAAERKVELLQPNAPVQLPAKGGKELAYQPISAAAELSLLPVPANQGIESAAEIVRRGYGYQRRLEKLRVVKDADPEVARIFEAIKARLGQPGDGLTEALAERGSATREVFGAYLEWVAHRGVKAKGSSDAEQEERKKLDPAMVQTRSAAIVDLIVERLVQLGVAIPDEPAKALLSLFRGGVERIQARADLWMLNDKVGEIYETEKALLAGNAIDPEALWKGIVAFDALDGGSPMGFQRPLKAGETRLVASGRVEHGRLPGPVQPMSLVKISTDLVVAERQNSLLNVAQQSRSSARALQKIEAKLAELDRQGPEYAHALDLYCSYSSALLYDSQKIWANSGVLDRLAEVAVLHGGVSHQEAVLDLIYGGLDAIRATLYTDFGRNHHSYRTVYLDLANLILAREHWDPATVGLVFEKLAWLQTFSRADQLSAADAKRAALEITQTRRNEPTDPSAVLAILSGPPAEPAYVRFGSYSLKLAVRETTADGIPVKTMEVRDLRTELKEDSEVWETLARLEKVAISAGFGAIQLASWSYHEAKVLRAEGQHREIVPPKVRGQSVAASDPTFIKTLQAKLEQPASWDLGALQRFLASDSSRGLIRLGNFAIAFRRPVVAPVPSQRCLTLTSVDADEPGSGKYRHALRTIEAEAKRAGFDTLVIEGVGDDGQRRFYEEKMAYQIVPGAAPEYRSYFVKLA